MNNKPKGYYLELLKGYALGQQIFTDYGISKVARFFDEEVTQFHREFLKNNSMEDLEALQKEVTLELSLQGYSLDKTIYKKIMESE